MTSGARQQPLGHWQGQVRMSDDFDAALPDAELAALLDDLAADAVQ